MGYYYEVINDVALDFFVSITRIENEIGIRQHIEMHIPFLSCGLVAAQK